MSLKVQSYDGKCYEIKLAPNQKVVEIRKGKYVIDMKENAIAAQNLSIEAYALYMHFMRNKNGYIEAVSVKHITLSTGLTEYSYYKAIKELIENNYLTKTEHNQIKEYYVFNERKGG